MSAEGPSGLVVVAEHDPRSGQSGGAEAFWPITTRDQVDLLADWLLLGGAPAPRDPDLAALQVPFVRAGAPASESAEA